MNPQFAIGSGRPYGAPELKRAYQTNLSLGLIMAIGLHLAGVGIGLLYAHLTRVVEGEISCPSVLRKELWVTPPPTVKLPPLEVSELVAGTRPEVGIPRAVPDESVTVEITIADRDELNRYVGTPTNLESGGGGEFWEIVQSPPPADPEISAFVKTEIDALPVVRVEPVYPSLALETGLSAVVMVRVLVDTHGRVKDAVVFRSSVEGLGFEQAALAAIRRWVFTPAKQNGHPIAVWINVPFKFTAR